MKTWRIASIVSSVSGILTIAFIATTPLRFPGFIIFWHSILASFIPILIIIGILPVRLRLSHTQFSGVLLTCALLFLGVSIFGNTGWMYLVLLLIPLLGMFIASRALSKADFQA